MLTYVDDDGKRQSMHWFLPRSKEDVRAAGQYHEFWFRHFKGGIFTRPPAGMNVVMYAQVDDPEPWAENSRFKRPPRDLRGNIERQWERVTREDLAISPMFLDVQYDRGRDDAHGRDADAGIREETDDGIVVRGWKAIGTTIPFVNELLIGNLWRPGRRPSRRCTRSCPSARRASRSWRASPAPSPTRTPTTGRSPTSATSWTGWSTSTTSSSPGPGPARRQPRPREVVPAAPVRLGPPRDPDPPHASTPS